jgi:glycerol-3-phosphate dehydrogenase
MAREESILDFERVDGGVEYGDAYLHDTDARFVWNFVRRALDYGCVATNYVESLGSSRDAEGQWVTLAKDVITGRAIEIRSRVLVNACGPFVDEQNEKAGRRTRYRHVLSKGIHLIVDRLTESRRVLTFFADDGRLFFVIPMGPKSCIGTTDTREQHLPPVVSPEDRRFVLDNVNKRLRLPAPLTEDSILAERCGVRPLVTKAGAGTDATADWMSLSRKHAIEVDRESSQISIFGGKLTDCLNVGEEISKLVRELGVELPYAGHRWYGEPPDQVRDEFFHEARLMGLDDLTSPESSEPLSTRLWRRYGESALRLLEDIRADPAMAEVLIHGTEYIRGELYHAARREMITKLEDFLRRRSKIALIARKETIKEAPGLFEACRILFGTEAPYKFYEYFGEPPSDAVIRDSVRPEPVLEQH